MALDASTPQVTSIIIADNEGERIVSKFWSPPDFPTPASEQDFERKLFKKTKLLGVRAEAEVLMLDGFTVVFKAGPDVTFAVVGPGDENDLMLVAVLDALWETMSLLLKGVVEKRTILAHLELLLLTLDELIEGGVPFELDAHTIEARVMLRGAVPDSISSYNEMTLSGVADKLQDRLVRCGCAAGCLLRHFLLLLCVLVAAAGACGNLTAHAPLFFPFFLFCFPFSAEKAVCQVKKNAGSETQHFIFFSLFCIYFASYIMAHSLIF